LQEVDENSVFPAILVRQPGKKCGNPFPEIRRRVGVFRLRLDVGGDQIGLQRAARPANACTFQQSRDVETVRA